MKKKDAISQLADALKSRDMGAIERATEAAGGAATVTAVAKDYTTLAKEHLDRAVMDLALERALSNLDQPVRAKNQPSVKAVPPLLPPMPRPPGY